MKRQSLVVLSVLIGAVGCHGAEPQEQTSYLVLDQGARAAGFTVDGDKAESPVLPVELETTGDVELVAGNSRVSFKPEAGKVAVIHGPEGDVEQRALGHEVDGDKLLTRGSEAAARELAGVLGGTYVKTGDGSFEITAENALGEASRISPVAGLIEVLPGALDDADEHKASPKAAPAAGAQRAANVGVTPINRAGGLEVEAVVPSSPSMYFDKYLPAAASCSDPATGVWRSYAHYPTLGEWYSFTMTVKRDPTNPNVLVGSIAAEFWEGDQTRETPVCSEKGEGGTHSAVRMAAKGTLDGSSFTFGGVSFTEEQVGCSKALPFGYNPDQFSGSVSGARFTGVNNDNGRSVDEPVEFRRVSCN